MSSTSSTRHSARSLRGPFSGIILLAALLVSGLVSVNAVARQQPQPKPAGQPVEFRWGFGAIAANEAWKLIPITQDTQLQSGDRLKVYIEPRCRCYIYVLFESAQKELTILFPTVRDLEAGVQPATRFYVPAGRDWLTLDKNTGQETVHLIASATPLTKLASLLRAHESSSGGKKAAAVDDVLTEIRALKQAHMDARVVERPVPIGGGVRGGVVPDVATLAVTISAPAFYSRTFTIDHR